MILGERWSLVDRDGQLLISCERARSSSDPLGRRRDGRKLIYSAVVRIFILQNFGCLLGRLRVTVVVARIDELSIARLCMDECHQGSRERLCM